MHMWNALNIKKVFVFDAPKLTNENKELQL